MNDYSIALYLHIVGALGFFVALVLEWPTLWQIRKATSPEQVRTAMEIQGIVDKLAPPSMLTIVLSGFYMVLKGWGGAPWVLVTLGALVLEIALFVPVAVPRMAAIGRAFAAEQGPVVPPTIHSLVNHPLLWISLQTRVAIVLGIVFLKVAKPGLTGSLLTIGVAIVLGLASALPVVRAERPKEGLAD